MTDDIKKNGSKGKRATPRTIIDKFASVEFSLTGQYFRYQYRIRDISPAGLCILVKEDSPILDHIKPGDIMNMNYYPINTKCPSEHLKTEIRHITKDEQGRFKGHYMVGLKILEKK